MADRDSARGEVCGRLILSPGELPLPRGRDHVAGLRMAPTSSTQWFHVVEELPAKIYIELLYESNRTDPCLADSHDSLAEQGGGETRKAMGRAEESYRGAKD
jgi:hypothetical protein